MNVSSIPIFLIQELNTLRSLPWKNPLDRFFSNFVNTLPIKRESKRRNKRRGGGGGAGRGLRAIANQTYHP